jgi:hypothetical protein
MKQPHKRKFFALSLSALLLAFGAAASGESQDAILRRYPYDPACPWGRISNGKGLLLRCIGESEAQALRAGALPSAPAIASAAPAPVAAPAVSAAPSAQPPADEPEANDGDTGAPSSGEKLDVAIGPVSADTGELGIGKLGAPHDRYVKCINDNGGLKDKTGEVSVRFLVRQRGRAEGVSVLKRSNVTAEAARCVAEVVDRRYVGVPEAPIVGATVVVKFSKAGK